MPVIWTAKPDCCYRVLSTLQSHTSVRASGPDNITRLLLKEAVQISKANTTQPEGYCLHNQNGVIVGYGQHSYTAIIGGDPG